METREYNNEEEISQLKAEKKAMIARIEKMRFCPYCGKEMTGNEPTETPHAKGSSG